MSGLLTNGMNLAPGPLTGLELAPFDTQLAGQVPETYAVSTAQIAGYVNGVANQVIATADNGTTQTLTAAMIGAANAKTVFHTSTGGSTPSLTLPLAASLISALGTNFVVGSAYILRIINANSGTATVVTNTGWTTSGTLTLATNTWREFLVSYTGAGALSFTSVGTGTYS